MRIGEMTKRIVSCLLCAVFTALAVGACAAATEPKHAKVKYGTFYSAKENFDVIFLGTSHMYNSVLPQELWKQQGISSYNWGYSNSTPAENYYIIQDVVKRTSPKLVVIDIFGLAEYEKYDNGKYRDDTIEQQHVQFDAMALSMLKLRAVKDVFDNYSWRDFLFNFIIYHNRWNELGKEDFAPVYTHEMGAEFLAGSGRAEYNPIPETERTEISTVCYPYFLDTLEFLSEKGIEVLCVCLPSPASEDEQRVANSVAEDIEKYPGCTYLNMLNLGLIDFENDIYLDNGHLNYYGAEKVTAFLGNYLRKNYSLDDYSGSPMWQKEYALYSKYKEEKLAGWETAAQLKEKT